MILTSIDLGYSTGLVVIDTNRRLILQMATFAIDELQSENMHNIWSITEAVILERMPKVMDQKLTAFYARILEEARNACSLYLISPGEWKPLAIAQRWKFRIASTQHERDAYNMFRYWYRKEYKKDIGELTCEN